jgi:DNA-binding transcriptional regulator YhcF (GntR family)
VTWVVAESLRRMVKMSANVLPPRVFGVAPRSVANTIEVLGVNTNTVLRALRDLRDEGLLEFRRGRGITVTGTPEQGAVLARPRDLLEYARQQGYRPDEVIRIIESLA